MSMALGYCSRSDRWLSIAGAGAAILEGATMHAGAASGRRDAAMLTVLPHKSVPARRLQSERTFTALFARTFTWCPDKARWRAARE